MRCRYCYQGGHNRNSCPAAAQDAEEAKNKIANGAERYSLNWKERFAYDIAEKKVARKAAGPSTTPRKCSYCGEVGHTRATCVVHKEDRAAMFSFEKRYRAAIIKYFSSIGLGIGAIIERDPDVFNNTFCILVTGFNPKALSLLNPAGNHDNFRGTYLDRTGWEGEVASFQFAATDNSYLNPFQTRFPYLVAAPGGPVEFPTNWMDDSEIEKRISVWFDEKATRRDRWNDVNKGAFHSTRPQIESYEARVKAFEVVM